MTQGVRLTSGWQAADFIGRQQISIEREKANVDTTVDKRIARVSALWYTSISLAVVALFLILVKILGGYPPAAIYGGAVWSFLLSMIVTMPVITARVKRWARGEA